MRNWNVFVVFLLLCHAQLLLGQNRSDSINNIINTTPNDSLKAAMYIEIAEEIDEDVMLSINTLLKASQLAKEIGEEKIEANAYNKIGIRYYRLGNLDQTLKYFYLVLSIYEHNTSEKASLASAYNNIGLVLNDLGRLEETLEYFKKSLTIKQELGDSLFVSSTLTNMALLYDKLGKYKAAQKYYFHSLSVDQRLNKTLDVFKDLSNIADNYMYQKNYDSAQIYYSRAQGMLDDIESPYSRSEFMNRLAKLNQIQKNYSKAEEYYKQALTIAESIPAKQLISNNSKGLSEIYKLMGNYKLSLRFYEKYMIIHEELFSEEQAQKLAQIENTFQIQSRENKISLLNKEAEINDLQLSKTQFIVYLFGGIIALIVLIIVLQYRKNTFKSKANNLLKSQNEEIIAKNKNIMDSILCAKNIQEAILPDDKKLNSVFSEAFVFNKARDIVSGDFYWFADRDDVVLIAAVDCTGHGVPAAFLNVMGNSILNQIVYESHVIHPAEVLRELNSRVMKTLKSDTMYVQVEDGMDIGLCMINKVTKKLTFAGAKRPLYFFHNKQLNEVPGDHFPVGGTLFDMNRNYKQHEIQLTDNDLIYLFTDGIVDQFGGERNKKFMYPRLRSILKQVVDKPLTEQKRVLETELSRWQGNNEQTDDMLLIGIKV